MGKVAVFCAEGLGDSLMMMVASCAYRKKGYSVTTFSNQLGYFKDWLPGFSFQKKPPIEDFSKILPYFDIVLLQHENSPKAKAVYELGREKKIPKLISFYNNYRSQKHYPIRKGLDFAFDEKKPMVENVAVSLQTLLGLSHPPKDIGLQIPSTLIHRKHRTTIVIHPTSSSFVKNWLPGKFLHLAKRLKKAGFRPILSLKKEESPPFSSALKEGIEIADSQTLSELASLLYEAGYFIGNDSGPAHLASYLHIPSLVIAHSKRGITHWRPGWKEASIVLPPNWVPNIKGMRFRDNYWSHLVSVKTVLTTFYKKVYSFS